MLWTGFHIKLGHQTGCREKKIHSDHHDFVSIPDFCSPVNTRHADYCWHATDVHCKTSQSNLEELVIVNVPKQIHWSSESVIFNVSWELNYSLIKELGGAAEAALMWNVTMARGSWVPSKTCCLSLRDSNSNSGVFLLTLLSLMNEGFLAGTWDE